MEQSSSPVELARESFGGALRVVVRHRMEAEPPTSDLAYVGDGVDAEPDRLSEYSATLARDFTFESIERRWHERVHDAGTLQSSVRVFDRTVAVRLFDARVGYSVHVDREALARVPAFVDAVSGEAD